MYYIDIKDALYFIVICMVVLEILGNGLFYRQQIAYTISYFFVKQIWDH